MFTLLTIAIIIGVFLAAKRRGGTLLVLSVLVAGLLALFDPVSLGFSDQQRPPAFRWAGFGVGTGMFLLTATLLITFYERKAVLRSKSRPKESPPVSLRYDLILATMTHLSRVEKFVKRFQPLQKGEHRSFQGEQRQSSPDPRSANQAY